MGSEQPRVEQQLDGSPPGLAHTGLNLEQLFRHMDVYRHLRIDFAQPQRHLAQNRLRHRAQTVKCRARALRARTAVPAVAMPFGADAILDRAQEVVRLRRESRLFGLERLTAEVTGLVQGGQEGEADAGVGRRALDPLPTGHSRPDRGRRLAGGAGSEIPRPRYNRS